MAKKNKNEGLFMAVIKVVEYNGHHIYLRQLGDKTFEYLLEYDGRIYQAHHVWTFRPGRTKHLKRDINKIAGMLLSQAITTIIELDKKHHPEATLKEGIRRAKESGKHLPN